MSSLTLLTEDQIYGGNNIVLKKRNQLEIFDKIGTKAAITDFAILLGGYVSNYCYNYEVKQLKNRTGGVLD